jgi:predicted Fe-Mo cluster-binding NifX family protein
MKIAIASLGKTKDSTISEQAGRAPFYLIFKDKKLEEIFQNPFRFGGGGAGTSVAKALSDKNVDIIIAGKFGENVKIFFEEKNIKLIEQKGKITDALK